MCSRFLFFRLHFEYLLAKVHWVCQIPHHQTRASRQTWHHWLQTANSKILLECMSSVSRKQLVSFHQRPHLQWQLICESCSVTSGEDHIVKTPGLFLHLSLNTTGPYVARPGSPALSATCESSRQCVMHPEHHSDPYWCGTKFWNFTFWTGRHSTWS